MLVSGTRACRAALLACIGAACVLGVACTPVPEDATLASPTLWEEARNNRGFVIRALSGVLSVWDTGLVGNETSATCGDSLQHKFNCTEEACEDLVSGYINYLNFFYCDAGHVFWRVLIFIMILVWMAFLLHLVETTTNNFFCASLTLAVDILKLSPTVAGVTFLAVGNAACDVIASIAAFSTGVPKVGVGTTLGAGIFVTTAVIAVVSFVADVRLARRSFVRDVMFFIITIVYLLLVSKDGSINIYEAVGFVIIYIIFLAVVMSGRFIRAMRAEEEAAGETGTSIGGATGTEGATKRVSNEIANRAGVPPELEAGFNAEDSLVADSVQATMAVVNRERSISDMRGMRSAADAALAWGVTPSIREDRFDSSGATASAAPRAVLGGAGAAAGAAAGRSALDIARTAALERARERELRLLKANSKIFDTSPMVHGDDEDDDLDDDEVDEEHEEGDAEEEEHDGDLGHGAVAGDAPAKKGRKKKAADAMADLPAKPSRWTRAFLRTQKDPSSAYAPFQWTSYHKRALAKELARRLIARGASTIIGVDGKPVDFLDLLATRPDEAAELAASIGTAVTAAASRKAGALTYSEAAAAASGGAYRVGAVVSSGTASGADVLSVLPHETIKPVAKMFQRLKAVVTRISPWYHKIMSVLEIPVSAARKLTIPTLHEGGYRRRLICIVMPFMSALFTVILTTHILKGSATGVNGFPFWVLAFIIGGVLGVALYFVLPKKPRGVALDGESDETARQSLLGGAPKGSHMAHDHVAHQTSKHGPGHKRPWYRELGIVIAGPNDEPLPRGPLLGFLLVASFVMALFWLLLIANELVGTAVFLGKVCNVPDVVMGLTVLAVGNSVNDLAASLTIARDGYASMAVAGAYAGPMFNILAGIGLPMIMYTAKTEDHEYKLGPMTPLVIMSYVALLTALVVTLAWVPLAGWRITHRIGRFLCAWFFLFILAVIIVGFSGLSPEDTVSVASG